MSEYRPEDPASETRADVPQDAERPVADPCAAEPLLKRLWLRPCGYREVSVLALPLVLSTSLYTVQEFIDRVFLSWHSREALAAALPAGIMVYTFMSFFLGTVRYVNTFVAQYVGAGRPERVGPAVWQAAHLALLSGLLMMPLVFLGPVLFRWAGHGETVAALENEYYQVLCVGAILSIYDSALSCFYTGRGKTWTIMAVSIVAVAVNIVLDYALIFGNWGFPEWGIRGAAVATVAASCSRALLFTILFLSPRNRREFNTARGWRLDMVILKRLMRYGVPSGVQHVLEVFGFTLFILLVGRLGTDALAATNLAIQVNVLAFLPLIGVGIATSTLVGQRLGREEPDLAARATWSSLHLSLGYVAVVFFFFLVFPDWFISPFAAHADAGSFQAVRDMTVVLLRFVAAYCLFDSFNVVFSSALRGAGDTFFVMVLSTVTGWLIMVLPTWFFVQPGGLGLNAAWLVLTLYIIVLSVVFVGRFLQGKWRTMRVIEPVGDAPDIIHTQPELPVDRLGL